MLTNTTQSYGILARALHWLVALLILGAVVLGLYANNMPTGSETEAAAAIRIFSLHKTLGMAAFAAALLRILWALVQPHPVPLHPQKRLETFAAAAVHWALYAAIVVLPLSGWVHHAAQPGFAPILWPFGQGLVLVGPSESLARVSGHVHHLAGWVLYGTLVLHILGALKHVLIDRDATLGRMTRGIAAGSPALIRRASVLAPVAALLLWAGVISYGALSARPSDAAAPPPAAQSQAQAETGGNWQVQGGSLSFGVMQMGSAVTGSFPDWTAEITFDPQTGTGSVLVTINTATLSLGAVTDQARGSEFFNTEAHPAALFRADIAPEGDSFAAIGTLSLRGVELPVRLPFTLELAEGNAHMEGQLTLDRRDFGMGVSYGDESTVGFGVTVRAVLDARRTD